VRRTVVCHTQEENVRRKEHAAKRKAVETGKVDADAAGGAKRQRMWWVSFTKQMLMHRAFL